MADYIVPRVEITQEFTQSPVFTGQPLAALILGPRYNLSRYALAAEKSGTIVTHPSDLTKTNDYQYADTVTYDWPNKASTAKVDQDYVKVFFEKAEALYFPHAALSPADSAAVTLLSGTTNQITSASLVFQTRNAHTASTAFRTRGVKIGDVIHVAGSTATVKSKVKGFVASKTAAATTVPNKGTEVGVDGIVGGNDLLANSYFNYVTGSTVRSMAEAFNTIVSSGTPAAGAVARPPTDGGNYVGYPALGVVSDRYTIEVTTGGTALAAVRFKITSAKGVFTAKTEQPFSTASTLAVDEANGNVVQLVFTNSTTFLLGQQWTLSASAAVTPVVPTVAGIYVGTIDREYKITITRGGAFYSGSNPSTCARATVTSDNVDSSPAVNVPLLTVFTVGTQGVTAGFPAAVSNDGLILGAVYYVKATAAKADKINIIVTQDSLHALTGNLSIKLFTVKASVEIPKIRNLTAGTVNWTTAADTITINSAVTLTEYGLTEGTDLADLAVQVAAIYVQHRDLVKDNTTAIASIAQPDEVAAKLGIIHPDNPLAQGVYDAALNSTGTAVYFVGVASDDLTGYNTALALARKSDAYYHLAPMTYDKTVRDAVVSHVQAMSDAKAAKWRTCWLADSLVETSLVLNEQSNGTNWTAMVSDNPITGPTDYTYVTIANAALLTTGIRSGDTLFINFRLDPAGKTIYDKYTIKDVLTQTGLVLETALPSFIASATKVQISRAYTTDEQIDAFALRAGEYNQRRAVLVFPDTYKSGSVEKNGYFLAASLAGLASGVPPHQSLTNIELLGVTETPKVVNVFSEEQLNRLAAEGVWIVTQKILGATAYSRHQLTTDTSSLNKAENSITRNVDSITKGLQKVLEPYIGVYNINRGTVLKIRSAIDDELNHRLLNTATERAGNQLNGYEILTVAQNVTFKDRIDIQVRLDVPSPANSVIVTLIV